MPKKSAAGRGMKREGEGEGGSLSSAKVTKTVAEGEWRASTIRERDLLRLVAERVVQEEGPSLPGRDNSPPQCQECWLKKLTKEERRDIPELMKRIKALKDKGITGESVAYSFIEGRIQPLQQRVHLGFEYQGFQDPSRMARDVPSVEEIMRRADLERFRSDPAEPMFEEPAQDPPVERDAGDAAADRPRPQRVVTWKWRTAAAANTVTSRQAMKLETPKPATSSTAQVGTSEHSLPKKPVAESIAEPPIIEDVPAVNEGKDLEPPASPEVELETEAPGTTPGPTIEEGTRTDQQGVASTFGQQDAPRASRAQEEHEVPEDSRVPKHQEGEVPRPKAELLEDPLLEPETVSLMLELGCRFTNYTKTLIDRSTRKSALLNQIGDVLLRTHEAEDGLEDEKDKNARLQEELATLKTSHRDAMIDQQRKHW
ncbi:retrotransposon protein, putative, Ty3-gypsy subclass [Panicum miliaceum]|uniref:Retrotransposon protein, putative, Ty3-gypsy subclass n=1 Tax=Panicum miliaceum TaxID=4540 RepID=A0A3L6RNH0_PANMI|nr:retrotransposon protein, putative, Ty3-gypsy subclass [Panicum miliaceum]